MASERNSGKTELLPTPFDDDADTRTDVRPTMETISSPPIVDPTAIEKEEEIGPFGEKTPQAYFRSLLPVGERLGSTREAHTIICQDILRTLLQMATMEIEAPPGIEEIVEILLAWDGRDKHFDWYLYQLSNYVTNYTTYRGDEFDFAIDRAQKFLSDSTDPTCQITTLSLIPEPPLPRAHSVDEETTRFEVHVRNRLGKGDRKIQIDKKAKVDVDRVISMLGAEGWPIERKEVDHWVMLSFRERAFIRRPLLETASYVMAPEISSLPSSPGIRVSQNPTKELPLASTLPTLNTQSKLEKVWNVFRIVAPWVLFVILAIITAWLLVQLLAIL